MVPVAESYVEAELVLQKFHSLDLHRQEVVKSDLWDLIKKFPYKSRSLAALVSQTSNCVFFLCFIYQLYKFQQPNSHLAANRAIEVGIKETELEGSVRSLEWLHNNGKCLDNLRPGISTINGAGRGAFGESCRIFVLKTTRNLFHGFNLPRNNFSHTIYPKR